MYVACCPWTSLLIIRDSKTLTCFLYMSTHNCLINKTKVVIKLLLLTVGCGTTGIPAFKSTAVIIWPPPRHGAVALLLSVTSCPALSPWAVTAACRSQPGALVVSCSCLLMLQVQLQVLACALLVELVNCWYSQKVRPWCVFTQCKLRITWQAVGEAAWVRWCRRRFPEALVLESSLKHHCCHQADWSWQPWLKQRRKQDKTWVQNTRLESRNEII